MKGSGVVHGFRSLADRIHPRSPLDSKESKHLLNALTSSFRSQLDAAHPQPAPEEFVDSRNRRASAPASKTAKSTVRSSASYADHHLASVLTSPLFVKGEKKWDLASAKADLAQAPPRQPIDILEDYHAKGFTTTEIAELCLDQFKADLAHLSLEEKREHILERDAGRRAFKCLVESEQYKTVEFADNDKLHGLLVYFLMHEGQGDAIWAYLQTDIQVPGSPISVAQVPSADQKSPYRWRGSFLRRMGGFKLGLYDHDRPVASLDHAHDALDLFERACEIKRAAPHGHHLELFSLYPLGQLLNIFLIWQRHGAVNGIDVERFDKFTYSLDLWCLNPRFQRLNRAMYEMCHPVKRSSAKAYEIASDLFSPNPSKAANQLKHQIAAAAPNGAAHTDMYKFFVRAIALLKEEGFVAEAKWLRSEMPGTFPSHIGALEEDLGTDRQDATSRTSETKSSNVESPSESLRMPLPAFT